jgi:hypothetical protein
MSGCIGGAGDAKASEEVWLEVGGGDGDAWNTVGVGGEGSTTLRGEGGEGDEIERASSAMPEIPEGGSRRAPTGR